MTPFADSSALVKRYVDEPGQESIRHLADLVISSVARIELASAIWRKHRAGELDAAAARVLVDAWDADYLGVGEEPGAFAVIAVDEDVLDEGARLVARYPLSSLDAIQLACAGAARRADAVCDTVVSFDGRLRDAASAEGFALAP